MKAARYISAAEFAGAEPTFRIRSIETVLLDEPDGSQREKLAAFFVGEKRGWVINCTNEICLGAMFGEAHSGWVGKRVTLTAAVVECGEGLRVGVRVKGSPHLDDDMDVFVQLPYREPYFMRLVPTRVSWLRKVA